MSKKSKLILSAAVTGLAIGAISSASAEEVKCWGVNSCGGKSAAKDKAGCGVNKAQVEAVKKDKELSGKFGKAMEHSCAGKAECAGKGEKGGNLNWTKISKEECQKLGGFLMDDKGKIEKFSSKK